VTLSIILLDDEDESSGKPLVKPGGILSQGIPPATEKKEEKKETRTKKQAAPPTSSHYVERMRELGKEPTIIQTPPSTKKRKPRTERTVSKPVVETAPARKDLPLAITNPGLVGAKKVEVLPSSPVSSPFSTASLMEQAEERTKGGPVKQEKSPILYNWKQK
jgi:hypothetical protein